jgi:hypothetical protein
MEKGKGGIEGQYKRKKIRIVRIVSFRIRVKVDKSYVLEKSHFEFF